MMLILTGIVMPCHQCLVIKCLCCRARLPVISILLSFPSSHFFPMADSSSMIAGQMLPANYRYRVSNEYSVTITEISAAFFYASCRLLAIHRSIKTDAASPPCDPAAFYKNMRWEMDVSPPNHLSMQCIDQPAARPLSLRGLPYAFRHIIQDTTTISSTSCCRR